MVLGDGGHGCRHGGAITRPCSGNSTDQMRDVADFQVELIHLEHLSADLQKQLASQRDTTRHSLTDDELRRRLDARRRARHNASEPANSAMLRSGPVSHAVHASDSSTY